MRTKAAISVSSRFASALIAYGSLIVVGRFFDPASFGMASFAMGLVSLLALVTDLGLTSAHLREVATGTDRNLALGVLVRMRLGLLAVLASLGAVALWFWWSSIAGPLLHSTTLFVLIAAFIWQVLAQLRNMLESTWQAEQKVNLIAALQTTESMLVFATMALSGLTIAAQNGVRAPLVWIGEAWSRMLGLEGTIGLEQGALLFLGSYIVGKTVTIALATTWAWTTGLRIGPWDSRLARVYMRLALPLSLGSIIALVQSSTDAVIIGVSWDAEEVAFYSAAQRVASMCLILGTAVTAILFPRFAGLHARGDDAGKDATFESAQRYMLILSTPLAAALIAMPLQALLLTVGPHYEAAIGPLRWLAAWALVSTLAMPIGARLMGEGRIPALVISMGLAAGLNVVLDILLVPKGFAGLGASGAALATLCASGASYVYLRAWAKYNQALPLWHAHIGRVVAAGAVVAVAWYAVVSYRPEWVSGPWRIIGVGVLGLAVYGGILAAIGELGRGDVAVLRRLLRASSWK